MTAATGYTQIHGLRPKDRSTTEAEPLAPLAPEQATHVANRHYADVNHCPHWTRGRYTNRYIALGP